MKHIFNQLENIRERNIWDSQHITVVITDCVSWLICNANEMHSKMKNATFTGTELGDQHGPTALEKNDSSSLSFIIYYADYYYYYLLSSTMSKLPNSEWEIGSNAIFIFVPSDRPKPRTKLESGMQTDVCYIIGGLIFINSRCFNTRKSHEPQNKSKNASNAWFLLVWTRFYVKEIVVKIPVDNRKPFFFQPYPNRRGGMPNRTRTRTEPNRSKRVSTGFCSNGSEP